VTRRPTEGRRKAGWLLIFIAALVGAVLISATSIRGRTPSTRMPDVDRGVSARQAHARVVAWAQEWLPDATVVRINTTHHRVPQADGGWTFQVYSAERAALAAVRVQDQEVSVLRETAALYPQHELPADDWRLDSSEAIQLWWENGGKAAWERTDAEAVSLRLGLNDAGTLTWQITVTWTQSDRLGFWEIDAGSGEVITIDTGGGSES